MDSSQERYNEIICLCTKYVLLMEKRKENQEAVIVRAEYDYNEKKTADNKKKGKHFQLIRPTPVDVSISGSRKSVSGCEYWRTASSH